METTNILVIPVGLDVGSRCVRVATGRSVPIETLLERAKAAAAALTSGSAATASSSSDASSSSNELDDLWPTLVVNADGQRWTRAVVARAAKSAEEDNVQHDEEHDHLWGDAAAATISSDATASGGWIRDLLVQQASVSNSNSSNTGAGASEEEDEEGDEIKTATTTGAAGATDNNNNSTSWTNAFFSHVMSSHIPQFQTAAAAGTATAAASAVTTTFAVVASVPPPSSSSSSSAASSNNNNSTHSEQYMAYLTQSIQHALNKTKRRQRKKMPITSSVIGVIADPVAIALAYSYYQYKTVMEQNNTNTSNNNTINNTNSSKNLLVLDGGASGLTWTWLQQAPSPLSSSSSSSSSTSPASLLLSQLWCIQQSGTSEQVSTRALVTAMAKHVSEQLEQQHRLERNSATQNKRAWYKLQHACEQQVLSRLLSPPSGSGSSGTRNWTVHMDGWYQGLDCHVVVSAPRLDHVLSPMQQQTKRMVLQALEVIQQSQNTSTTEDNKDQVITVLLAGSLHAWMKPLVEGVLRQWNNNTTTPNIRVQLSTFATPQQVPPEEMVAMGCALQAQWILTKAAASLLRSSNAATHHVAPPLFLQPRMRVWKSPITIGISYHTNNTTTTAAAATNQNGNHHAPEKQDNMMVLITRHSTWLPCHLTHALRPLTTNHASSSAMVTWTLWQLKNNDGGEDAAAAQKALAQLELPSPLSSSKDNNDYSLTLFLSEQGTLHMTLSGSDQVVTLAPILDGSSGDEDGDDDDDEEDDHDLD